MKSAMFIIGSLVGGLIIAGCLVAQAPHEQVKASTLDGFSVEEKVLAEGFPQHHIVEIREGIKTWKVYVHTSKDRETGNVAESAVLLPY